MRIKNQKANYKRYVELEKQNYDKIVNWLKTNVTEESKSKAKIIQSKLLDFFTKVKKPTVVQTNNLLNLLKVKYLQGYDITFYTDYVNSLDDDETLFFDIYLNMGGYYMRQLIQHNCLPNIFGKKIILDLEVTDEEISMAVRERTIIELPRRSAWCRTCTTWRIKVLYARKHGGAQLYFWRKQGIVKGTPYHRYRIKKGVPSERRHSK